MNKQPFENKKTHESFGIVGWSRVSGTSNDLFGSTLSHDNTVRITISEGVLYRDLNRDWFGTEGAIVEIELSPIQFSEFLTTPNQGVGIPCTIRYLQGKGSIKGVPIESKRMEAEKEFKQSCLQIGKEFNVLEDHVKNLNIGKGVKEGIMGRIYEVSRIVRDYIPFMQSSFNEQVDKSVIEAKHSVEAYVEGKIRQVGLENINSPKLLTLSKDEE